MDLPPFHRRVLEAGLPVCDTYSLVLAGGYAMRAHGLVDRPSQDLDLATDHQTPLPDIAEAVATAYRSAGFEVTVGETTPRMAHLYITDGADGEMIRVDLLKEALQRPPVRVQIYPVVALDDAVGLKMRALHGRSIARDIIDVASVSGQYGFRDLERLCSRHEEEFSVGELAGRLGAVDLIDDSEFEAYGLDEAAIARVRRFAFDWLEDIKQRRSEDGDIDPAVDLTPYPD